MLTSVTILYVSCPTQYFTDRFLDFLTPGYSGVTCNIAADPCASNPCGSVATCTSTVTDYICQCEQGKIFTGTQCKGTINSVVQCCLEFDKIQV